MYGPMIGAIMGAALAQAGMDSRYRPNTKTEASERTHEEIKRKAEEKRLRRQAKRKR